MDNLLKRFVVDRKNIFTNQKEWIRLLTVNGYTVEKLPITQVGTDNAYEDFGKTLREKYYINLDKDNYGYVFYFTDGRMDFILRRKQINGDSVEARFGKGNQFKASDNIELGERAVWGFYLQDRFSNVNLK